MKIIETCVAEAEGGGLYGREKICSSLFYELRASDTTQTNLSDWEVVITSIVGFDRCMCESD
jgi:hypothetical protein